MAMANVSHIPVLLSCYRFRLQITQIGGATISDQLYHGHEDLLGRAWFINYHELVFILLHGCLIFL
jgi:hypothetical protein